MKIPDIVYPINASFSFTFCEGVQTVHQALRITASYPAAGISIAANFLGRFLPQTRVGIVLKGPDALAKRIYDPYFRFYIGMALPSTMLVFATLALRVCYNSMPNALKGIVLGTHAAIASILSLHNSSFHIFTQREIVEVLLQETDVNHTEQTKRTIETGAQVLSGLALLASSVGLTALRFHPITTNAIAYSIAALTAALSKNALQRLTNDFYSIKSLE